MQANYFAFIGPESEGRAVGAPYERKYETGVLAATALFYILERAYFAREYGRLGDQEWRRYEQSMCSNFSRQVFPRLNRGWFTDEFVEFLDDCLRSGT